MAEECWKIRTEYPVRASVVVDAFGRWKLDFDPMTISYDDYEKMGHEIDHDRVYVGGVNVYDYTYGLHGTPPREVNGKMVLPGKSGGSYSYDTGKASFWFRDEIVCREHVKRLAERGLISIPAPAPMNDLTDDDELGHKKENISVETHYGPAFNVKGPWYVSPKGLLCKPDGEEGDHVRVVAAYHTGSCLVLKTRFQNEFKLYSLGASETFQERTQDICISPESEEENDERSSPRP